MSSEVRVRNHRTTVPAKSGEPVQVDWIEIDGILIRVDRISVVEPIGRGLAIFTEAREAAWKFDGAEELVRAVRRALGVVEGT